MIVAGLSQARQTSAEKADNQGDQQVAHGSAERVTGNLPADNWHDQANGSANDGRPDDATAALPHSSDRTEQTADDSSAGSANQAFQQQAGRRHRRPDDRGEQKESSGDFDG